MQSRSPPTALWKEIQCSVIEVKRGLDVPVEMAMWRMTDQGPEAVSSIPLDLESRLEDLIVEDVSLVDLPILVIGRQVLTSHGGYLDVLGVDADGQLHVLELKRDRTPREVIAQILNYGSWAQGLSLSDVKDIYQGRAESDFDTDFVERFGVPVPDTFNADQQLTVVASELDATSERIVEYLVTRYGVPLNAVFFRHFRDGDSEYLARTWLRPPEDTEISRSTKSAKVRPWNGRDFYVILGTVDRHNRWPVCRKYGIVSASGGPAYTKPLRNLAPGHRVFAYVGGAGYVGTGEITGTAVRLDQYAKANSSILQDPETPDWMKDGIDALDDDLAQWVVPVEWSIAKPISDAFWEKGLFASQVTVCKLRDQRTIEEVSARFGLEAV